MTRVSYARVIAVVGVMFPLLVSGCGNTSNSGSTKQEAASGSKAATPPAPSAPSPAAAPSPAPAAPLPIPQVAPSAAKAPAAPAPATSPPATPPAPAAAAPPPPAPAAPTPPAGSPPAPTPAPAAAAVPNPAAALGGSHVVLTTAKGPIEIELFDKDCPAHSQNFKRLAQSGFFNGTGFHLVCFGFVQGGDPTASGKGGIEQPIAAEIKRPCLRGSVVAARRGDEKNPTRASHGSQFFILKQDQPSYNGQYTVFGQVVAGMEVVDRIPLGDKAQDYRVAAAAEEKILKAEVK
jgi:cyclophilin family peptidyl-prolyl cis-trans isomerase